MVVFSTYGIMHFYTNKGIWLILLPPVLMTSLDLLIEPVAIKLGFWFWKNDIIPLQNYAMWFVTSIFIRGIIYLFQPKINAKISFIIIGVSALFFGFLNIFLYVRVPIIVIINNNKSYFLRSALLILFIKPGPSYIKPV